MLERKSRRINERLPCLDGSLQNIIFRPCPGSLFLSSAFWNLAHGGIQEREIPPSLGGMNPRLLDPEDCRIPALGRGLHLNIVG